jgi:hypothetical protein
LQKELERKIKEAKLEQDKQNELLRKPDLPQDGVKY